jgi:uncharacterized membrane protein
MKNRWLIFGLVLSLAFNLTFLGAYGYRLWQKKGEHRAEGAESARRPAPLPDGHGPFWKNLRPEQRKHLQSMRREFFPRMHEIRGRLRDERKALGDLLMKDKPDTVEIIRHLNRIGELQTRIERLVTFQLVKETESMDPQQREAYIKMIIRRMGERSPGDPERPRRPPESHSGKEIPKEKQP